MNKDKSKKVKPFFRTFVEQKAGVCVCVCMCAVSTGSTTQVKDGTAFYDLV